MISAMLLALCVSTDAFTVPAQPPCAQAICQRAAAPLMIDTSILIGAGAMVGGLGLGAGFIAFVEGQGQRSNERGGMSDETKSRMAGKFMEDEELVSNYDDTITKMEEALAKAEGREVIEGDGLTAEEREKLREAEWGESL